MYILNQRVPLPKRKLIPVLIMAAVLLTPVFAALISSRPTSALSGSDFNAGHIIDDAVFYQSDSMSSAEVQNFLNSKMPSCDTNGTVQKTYYYQSSTGKVSNYSFSGGVKVTTSRATYGSRYDHYYATTIAAAPYICLKNYKQDTPVEQADSGICGYLSAKTGRTAAQIITDVGSACGINPKVLIVLLQKEQGLVTDDWPWANEYQKATGYACPDGSPCDSKYYGFFNQVYNAAWQFRMYRANPDNYNFVAGQTNLIPYNPNSSCGKKSVFITNQATAGLYDYTPYVPNTAALNNLYGTGDSCSAYGNRNFWVFFNEWFGSTNDSVAVNSRLRLSSTLKEGIFTQDNITLSFDLLNTTSSNITVQVAVAARTGSGENVDFPLKSVTVPAGSKATYSASRIFMQEDTYTFWITSYHDGKWDNSYPESNNVANPRQISQFIQAIPTISHTPSDSEALRQGKANTLSFEIKNNSSRSVNLGYIGLAARDPSGKNEDLPFQTVSALAAGTTFSYSEPFTPAVSGNHTFFISTTIDGGKTWDSSLYPSVEQGIERKITLNVLPNPTITQGPLLSTASPHLGQNVTGTFVIHNYGDTAVSIGGVAIAIRGPGSVNRDMPLQTVTIQPGQDYTYSYAKSFPTAGAYTAWIANYRGGKWYDNYPAVDNGSVQSKINFTVLANPTITQGPLLSIPSPHVGQSTTGTFVIHNYGDTAVSIGGVAIAIRGPGSVNRDMPLQTVTIQPGQDYTYSYAKSFPTAGAYTAWIANYRGGKWYDNYPAVDNGSVQSKINFTVSP